MTLPVSAPFGVATIAPLPLSSPSSLTVESGLPSLASIASGRCSSENFALVPVFASCRACAQMAGVPARRHD